MSAAEALGYTDHMVTREHGDRPATKEARVRYVMALMATGRYVRGETSRELSEAWGLAMVTIEADTAEASRRVLAVTDPDYVRTRLATALDRAVDMAASDPKAVAAVSNAYAPLVGAQAPQRHQIDVALLARITDEQAAEIPGVRRLLETVIAALRSHPAALADVMDATRHLGAGDASAIDATYGAGAAGRVIAACPALSGAPTTTEDT